MWQTVSYGRSVELKSKPLLSSKGTSVFMWFFLNYPSENGQNSTRNQKEIAKIWPISNHLMASWIYSIIYVLYSPLQTIMYGKMATFLK